MLNSEMYNLFIVSYASTDAPWVGPQHDNLQLTLTHYLPPHTLSPRQTANSLRSCLSAAPLMIAAAPLLLPDNSNAAEFQARG